MHVDVIDEFETLVRSKDNWISIYEADPESQYFLSWAWISNWLNHIDEQWLVLAAKPTKDSVSYVAFFPVLLVTSPVKGGGFYNSIFMAGSPLAGFTGFICDPQFENLAIPALADNIKAMNWADMYLDTVYASDMRLRLFTERFSQQDFAFKKTSRKIQGQDTDYSVYPYIRLPQDWEEYLRTHLGPNTRKNARRCMKLVDSGECRITHADADTFERDLNTLSRFWTAAWQPVKGAPDARSELNNHCAMLRACFAEGEVFMPVLWQGDRPIGVRARLIDRMNRSLICLIGSRDLSIKRPPAGFILHLYSIRWAIQNGFEIYDFQIGNHTYKYDFGPEERRIDAQIVYTANGQNLGDKLDRRCLPYAFGSVLNLTRAGRYLEANIGCNQILQVDPSYEDASRLAADFREKLPGWVQGGMAAPLKLLAKSTALLRNGKATEAQRLLVSVVDVLPQNFDAQHMLGMSFLMEGNFEAAEKHIGIANMINPGMSAAHYNRGRALAGLGRYREALLSYDRAIELNPKNGQAYDGRGSALVKLDRHQEAIPEFDKAIARCLTSAPLGRIEVIA